MFKIISTIGWVFSPIQNFTKCKVSVDKFSYRTWKPSKPQPIVKIIFSSLVMLLTTSTANAWNVSGTLKSKVQADNRYSHKARVFGEVWGSLEVFDNKTWRGGLDFVSRQSDEEGFEGEVYQLYIEKQLPTLNTRVKAGRFQRADSLGYYNLDGANIAYDYQPLGLTVQAYAGVPRRMEDVRSVSGEWLYGFDAEMVQRFDWQNSLIAFDDWFFRAGFQQMAEDDEISSRLNLATTTTGRFKTDYLQGYELSVMGVYEFSTATFEDFMVNAMVDVSDTLRLRTSYELYHPREPYVTFREQFSSIYVFGRQDLLRLSLNHQIHPDWQYHVGFLRATQDADNDAGYGGNAGVVVDAVLDLTVSAEVDYLEMGKDSSFSVFLSSNYSITSNHLLNVNLALRWDKKSLYDENQSTGVELEYRYRINSNLFVDASSSYIWNTQVNHEYLTGLRLTYYLDNFQPKAMQ